MRVLFFNLILLSFVFSKDTIIVSVPPQKYFVEQIVKNKFNVKSMMDEDSILPNYHPTAQQYIWTENAKAYFTTGIFDEKIWIKTIKITNSNIKIFNIAQNIKIKAGYSYIWLDPTKVRIQAKNILNAVIKLDNKNKKFYRKNYFAFVNKVSRIDYQIRSILKKTKYKYFLIFEPTYYYYAKRYKLNQIQINADPFSANKTNILSIITQINKYDGGVLLIPKYHFPKQTLKIIYKTKAIIVPYSHLEYNWEDNIINLAKIISYNFN
jgi:zinc transport system substrate-binding protein